MVDLRAKGHQYSKVPRLISEAEDPTVAEMCVVQLESIPVERQTTVVVNLKKSCLEHLKVLDQAFSPDKRVGSVMYKLHDTALLEFSVYMFRC